MKCLYSREVYSHSMSMRPESVETGEVELAVRPLAGDEVNVDGKWILVNKVQISSDSVNLVLNPSYKSGIRAE